MNNHENLDSMLEYIHESIKRDCYRHIMMNRISCGLPPVDETVKPFERRSIISENKIDGFKGDSIFDWTKNFIFPTVKYERRSWIEMLMLARYYSEQKRILLADLNNHNKPNIDNVIWSNHLNFRRNYTEDLKISKWKIGYITKEMWPDMSDDEIRYANVMWNCIFDDKPYTSDFNKIKSKNSWLERKTKRGK